MDPAYGDRRRGTDRGEPRRLVQGRRDLRGHGLEAIPQRGYHFRRLAGYHRIMPPRFIHHQKTT